MRITVEFESLEEFQKYLQGAAQPVAPAQEAPRAAQVEEVPTTEEEAPTGAPVAIPWEAPEEAVEAKAPAVTEDFRVEVRKTLAALNKQKTGNPAKALIAETGYKKLTDVPLELLPGLMEKAKEALNG